MDKIERTIDANINRASEGLRVLEDIFRFVFNDALISAKLKNIRHKVRTISDNVNFIKYRKIQTDVGKSSFSEKEKKRDSVEALLIANFKRTQESCRVLEEFFKCINENSAFLFKKLRFEIYDIEQTFFSLKLKLKNILENTYKPILYGIIDTRFSHKNHIEICNELIQGGIEIIQLREKLLPDNALLQVSNELSNICEEFDKIFIVNDRVDIAALSNASGVHLGQDDIPVEKAKQLLGHNKLFGLSTHNLEQVKEANEINPDYIGFGPVFPTKSKKNPDPVVGLSNLLKVKSKFPLLPVVAIGGINTSNIAHVINCKPDMVCVMSGIISKNDIISETKLYRRMINDTIRDS